MKRIKFLVIGLLIVGAASVSSCKKEETIPNTPTSETLVTPETPSTPSDPSICNGTDVANNTWAVIHKNGETTMVQKDEAVIQDSANTTNDKIRYTFKGINISGPNENGTVGADVISFLFKGDNPPASGTYTLVTAEPPSVNEVYMLGAGGGTSLSGGGLFPFSGNITVTNNNGVITFKGKGVKFHTALSVQSNLCVSFNLTK